MRPLRALYPGSFDPVTFGHLDLIERASGLFDEVLVAVLRNPNKQPLFSLEERLQQLRLATGHLATVEVTSFEGLTVHFALQRQARVILRGLRALSDFEFELQLAHTNSTLSEQVDTLFMATAVLAQLPQQQRGQGSGPLRRKCGSHGAAGGGTGPRQVL